MLTNSFEKARGIKFFVNQKYFKLKFKDGYLLGEMAAFGYVSTTFIARLLAVYNALKYYDKPTRSTSQLKDTVKLTLLENSETTFFEIMITFEDTLNAFPDVVVNLDSDSGD